MNKQDFLEHLRVNKRALVRCYRAAEDTYPEDYPWASTNLFIQEHNGQISFITPDRFWVDYSPKYDIEAFDGEMMTFVAEDYIMDVKI